MLVRGSDSANSKVHICDPATGTSQWITYSNLKDSGNRKYEGNVYY